MTIFCRRPPRKYAGISVDFCTMGVENINSVTTNGIHNIQRDYSKSAKFLKKNNLIKWLKRDYENLHERYTKNPYDPDTTTSGQFKIREKNRKILFFIEWEMVLMQTTWLPFPCVFDPENYVETLKTREPKDDRIPAWKTLEFLEFNLYAITAEKDAVVNVTDITNIWRTKWERFSDFPKYKEAMARFALIDRIEIY